MGDSGRAADPAPERIRPMKAVSGALPTGPDWAYEIKWDGMRVVAENGPQGIRAHSSRLNEVGGRFPELESLHAELGDLNVVLDGEIVALGDDGLPSFSRLQGRMHLDRPHDIQRRRAEVPVIYVVFDILRIDNTATTGLPYTDRRRLLEELLSNGPTWQIASSHRDGGAELLAAVAERGMEGLVAKRKDSTYQPGRRSSDWVKVKTRRRQEFVVGGWVSGEGGRAGTIGSLLVGHHDDHGLRYAGRVGSGLTSDEIAALTTAFGPLATATSPFVDEVPPVRGRSLGFVQPTLVVEVEFAEWTPDGNLRHPVYLGRRADAVAQDVVREPHPAADPEP